MFTLVAAADTLDTLDGQSFSGRISFAADGFVVAREGASPVRVPVAGLRRVAFDRGLVAAPPVATNHWRGQPVGPIPVTGGFTVSNGVFHVSSSGTGKRMADGHYFVWDTLGPQAELTAFVPPQLFGKRDVEKFKSAGLEMRAQLAGEGPRISLFSEGGRNVLLQTRLSDGRDKSRYFSIAPHGIWLRLTRRGLEVSGAMSTDGEAWKELGSIPVALPDSAFAGLLLCGSKREGECTVAFQSVQLQSANAARPPALPQLLLRDGGVLAGRFVGVDGSVIRWEAWGREWSVAQVNVSRLVLQPGAQTLMNRVRPGRAGGMMVSGDFVDGELVAGPSGQVRISSVLFGLRTYAAAGELVAVFVRDVAEAPLEFEARMVGGSRLHLRQLTLREGEFTARERSLGEVTLRADELLELRRTASP
ncbi:MAG: hypothetical protein B9S33_11130 [Pedosphaera sp. Tous-C6FEB]|nr:MAG: hypothetical protein B9S33_11130 [Pedosphaera sp. Tous-C6FEB]